MCRAELATLFTLIHIQSGVYHKLKDDKDAYSEEPLNAFGTGFTNLDPEIPDEDADTFCDWSLCSAFFSGYGNQTLPGPSDG